MTETWSFEEVNPMDAIEKSWYSSSAFPPTPTQYSNIAIDKGFFASLLGPQSCWKAKVFPVMSTSQTSFLWPRWAPSRQVRPEQLEGKMKKERWRLSKQDFQLKTVTPDIS